jgi:hypothetical protein
MRVSTRPLAYDSKDFVNELRSMNATPHVAENTNGRAARCVRRTPATPLVSAFASGSRKLSVG